MIRVSSLLSLVAALLLAAPPAHAFMIQLALDGPAVPRAGEPIRVLVTAADLFAGRAGDGLLAYGFSVAANAAALTDVTLAAGFTDDRTAAGLEVAASIFPALEDPGVALDLLLATLTLHAPSAGPVLLQVSADPTSNLFAGLFFASGAVAGFTGALDFAVAPALAPVPPPAWLVAGGLMALLGGRRLRTAAKGRGPAGFGNR